MDPGKVKKILLVRTDRIGDLLLSTPAIRALRRAYPNSEITLILNPKCREIIEKNPDVDKFICYDEKDKGNNLGKKIGLFKKVKKSKFDLAIIMHPSKFFHILAFLAGIPRRMGYNKKSGFLLTDKIQDKKYLAQKHEVEYNLDLVKLAGAETGAKDIIFVINDKDKESVAEVLDKEGVGPDDRLVAIHPGTSNILKKWQTEKFAKLADKLINDHNIRVCVIGSEGELNTAGEMVSNMQNKAVDLTGRFSLGELGAFFQRCKLLISNDSGPVHIASAVKTPVVAIFAKGVYGVSPTRWGPTGADNEIIYEKLDGLTVEKVLDAVKKRL